MTNEEIIKHIETNCRNEHGEPMMDEQAFYEGAKWYREQQLKILNIPDVSQQSELLNDFLVKLRRSLNITHSRPLSKYIEFYLKGIL